MNIKLTKKSSIFTHFIFIIVFSFSCFTMASNNFSGYFSAKSTVFVFWKFLIVIISVIIVTLLEYKVNKDFLFISISAPIIANSVLIVFVFDHFVMHIGGSNFIYRSMWLGYIFCAWSTLFFVVTVCAKWEKGNSYSEFYKRFWYGFTPFFLVVFLIVFARDPFSGGTATLNLVPFGGTFLMLEAMLDGMRGGIEPPLLFFGNFFFFIPLGFLIPFYFSNIKWYIHLLMGAVVPFCIEGYQYIFGCGDVDVDDLILNIGGFIAGYFVYALIKKYRLNKKEAL